MDDNAIPTADHDASLPPLIVGAVDHLGLVLIDGHRWAVAPPGDMIGVYLLDGEGRGHGGG